MSRMAARLAVRTVRPVFYTICIALEQEILKPGSMYITGAEYTRNSSMKTKPYAAI